MIEPTVFDYERMAKALNKRLRRQRRNLRLVERGGIEAYEHEGL